MSIRRLGSSFANRTLLLALLISFSACSATKPGPGVVAKRYIEALAAGNIDKAYEDWSLASQSKAGAQAKGMLAMVSSMMSGAGSKKPVSFEVKAEKIDGARATVDFEITLADGTKEQGPGLPLVRENGNWRVLAN